MARQASGMHGRCVSAGVALAALMLATAPAWASPDVSDKAGVWTLGVEGAHRMCRMNLRVDPSGTGWGLAMPPGCRRAVPSLKDVQSWSMPSDGQISLDDGDGRTVVLFDGQAAGGLHGTDREGEALSLTPLRRASAGDRPFDEGAGSIVSLRPVDPSSPAVVSSLALPAAAPAVAPNPAVAPAVPPRDAPGRYAVLRGDRDTGCMVTLDATGAGARSVQKARLAPACRDQGIIIFDPLGWQVVAGRLVLTARKGHTIQLDRTTEGVWVKEPKDFKALGLKPI